MCGSIQNRGRVVYSVDDVFVHSYEDGDLAQMVERTLSMREAQGSIPWFSTLFVFLSDLGFNACGVLCLPPYNKARAANQREQTKPKRYLQIAKRVRSPGIEPGSITWQATIITTRPRARYLFKW